MYETKRQAFQRGIRAAERARDKAKDSDLATADGKTLIEALDVLRAVDAGTLDAFGPETATSEALLYIAHDNAEPSLTSDGSQVHRAITVALCVLHLAQVKTDAHASVIADDAEEVESGKRPDPTWQTGLSETMVAHIREKIAALRSEAAFNDAREQVAACQGGIASLADLLTFCGVPVDAPKGPHEPQTVRSGSCAA